jgi:glyoxylase-like metal-dependent hydrolase (beta-lactamase superfamily II)
MARLHEPHHAHDHGAGCGCSRRGLLGGSLSCAAYVTLGLGLAASPARRLFAAAPKHEAVQTTPFARVEQIADGVWAVVSTPFAAGTEQPERTTFSNGGIVAGRDGVLAIEGFMTPAGAAWQSDLAQELTGRRPTHVVLTHYHGDHSSGLAGYAHGADLPAIVGTAATRELLWSRQAAELAEPAGNLAKAARLVVLPDQVIVDAATPTVIDLGGRVVRLTGRSGHSPSDLTIEIDEPRVVWCGDLVFNGVFPYFGDATPSVLGATCNAILTDPDTLYAPGHGALATAEDLAPYREVLAHVEQAARAAHAAGTPVDQAWQGYTVPASLGEWFFFRPDVASFAFQAWYRELDA